MLLYPLIAFCFSFGSGVVEDTAVVELGMVSRAAVTRVEEMMAMERPEVTVGSKVEPKEEDMTMGAKVAVLRVETTVATMVEEEMETASMEEGLWVAAAWVAVVWAVVASVGVLLKEVTWVEATQAAGETVNGVAERET